MGSEIDVQQIKSWIEGCKTEHGTIHDKSYFQPSDTGLNIPNFVIIDVERKCLTVLGEGEEYVALSYVWGTTNRVTTTKANVEIFSRENAFEKVSLPKTIQESLDLVGRLGYRYLWVDALCIVQDDESSKVELINNMDRVYAESAVTIVAASGWHADAGLSGYQRSSRDSSDTVTEWIAPDLQLGVLPHLHLGFMDSDHAKRGWT